MRKILPRVRQKLRDLGLADNARMIENCGFESQRIYTNLKRQTRVPDISQ